MVGGSREETLPLSIAIELLHMATLVQDDIIDGEDRRRGKSSLHKEWSEGDAILVADGLICLAIDRAADFGKEVMKSIARMGLTLCDGEHLDMNSSLDATLETEYLSLIERKSASLFQTAAYCGAWVGCGDLSQINLLAEFGKYYGIAYQIKDDIADFTEREGIPRDLINANPTLPIIHLYGNCDKKTKQIINDVFNLRRINRKSARELCRELERTGSLEYSLGVMREKADQARSVLAYFTESESKLCLAYLVDSLSSIQPAQGFREVVR